MAQIIPIDNKIFEKCVVRLKKLSHEEILQATSYGSKSGSQNRFVTNGKRKRAERYDNGTSLRIFFVRYWIIVFIMFNLDINKIQAIYLDGRIIRKSKRILAKQSESTNGTMTHCSADDRNIPDGKDSARSNDGTFAFE